MTRDEKWKRLFLDAFRESGIISQALMISGVSRGQLRSGLDKDPEFLEAFHDAKADAIDSLETEAVRRAKDGSDQLLMFLLKSHRPEVYRENHKIEISGHLEVDHRSTLMEKLTTMAEALQAGSEKSSGMIGSGVEKNADKQEFNKLKSRAEDVAFIEVDERGSR
jgi:hypothetical protein